MFYRCIEKKRVFAGQILILVWWHTLMISSQPPTASDCPKTLIKRTVACKASTYLSRWKYEHCTLPVCAASTLRSGHASSRRRSQASCSAPAQTPTNRHIQIKATTHQQQQKSTDLLHTWGRGNILKRIYFTLSRIVHCLYRQHELPPTWWIKKGTQKATVVFSILHVYNWTNNTLWMYNSWSLCSLSWHNCAPQMQQPSFARKTDFYDHPLPTVFFFLLEEVNSFTLGNSDLWHNVTGLKTKTVYYIERRK